MLAADGRAWKVDGRAQALVGPGLATPLQPITSYPLKLASYKPAIAINTCIALNNASLLPD